MKRWLVTCESRLEDEDTQVKLSGMANVEAEDEDAATIAGMAKVAELNIFEDKKPIIWEHVKTSELKSGR